MTEIRILHHDLDLAFGKPWLEPLVEQRCCADCGMDLAALHREACLIVALISGYDLPARTQQCVLCARQGALESIRTDRRGHDLALSKLGDRMGRGGMPDHVRRYARRRAADVVEAGRVEPHPLYAKRLLRRQVLSHHGDDRPISWRDLVEIVHSVDARGSGHWGRHDGRIAGYETAEVLHGQPDVERVSACRTAGADETDLLAGEVVSGS